MKFLIIASYPGSILKFRGALIEALQNKGFEIHIAAPEFGNHPEDVTALKNLGYNLHNIPLQRTGTNPLKDAAALSALYLIMKKVTPSYVMSYTIKPVIYGTLAAWAAKIPNRYALITGLGYAFQQVEETGHRSKLQKLIHGLYKQALAKTSKVFFQNPDDLNLFKQLELISSATPTAVVNGSGVDISEYEIAPLPITDDQTTELRFLMIARLLGDKGVREYVQAAKRIKAKYPQTQFDLVGWIDDNPDSIEQQELDSWIKDGTINFWGKLADVKPAIAASSIYVLPSYREGTPRTVLEAMAMGRPIITTDAPGCRETVTDGVNGFLVPVKSVVGLTEAMEKFITDPGLINTMGKASRKIAEEKFDVHAVNNFMLKEMGL
ncbi:glycosyltransferase family 4 protein [Psychrobacter raelei]|uniref:Glycosyltransferase family 4 protein n=1 Tax=Psychrobacter raelei TaxID=2565531 RepID=A0AAU6PV93_9GAMM